MSQSRAEWPPSNPQLNVTTMSDPGRGEGKYFEDPIHMIARGMTKLYSFWLSTTYPFAAMGKQVSIHPTALLTRRMASRIKMGNAVMIRKDAWLNVVREADANPKIIIDDGCLIGARSVISAINEIHIKSDVILATSVLIMDHNHAYEDTHIPIKNQGITRGGKIRIEPGCWIGHGAAIVCNEGELVLGRNSVVAANALVTRSFPANSVIVGNPGRLARQFDTSTGVWRGAGGHAVGAERV